MLPNCITDPRNFELRHATRHTGNNGPPAKFDSGSTSWGAYVSTSRAPRSLLELGSYCPTVLSMRIMPTSNGATDFPIYAAGREQNVPKRHNI